MGCSGSTEKKQPAVQPVAPAPSAAKTPSQAPAKAAEAPAKAAEAPAKPAEAPAKAAEAPAKAAEAPAKAAEAPAKAAEAPAKPAEAPAKAAEAPVKKECAPVTRAATSSGAAPSKPIETPTVESPPQPATEAKPTELAAQKAAGNSDVAPGVAQQPEAATKVSTAVAESEATEVVDESTAPAIQLKKKGSNKSAKQTNATAPTNGEKKSEAAPPQKKENNKKGTKKQVDAPAAAVKDAVASKNKHKKDHAAKKGENNTNAKKDGSVLKKPVAPEAAASAMPTYEAMLEQISHEEGGRKKVAFDSETMRKSAPKTIDLTHMTKKQKDTLKQNHVSTGRKGPVVSKKERGSKSHMQSDKYLAMAAAFERLLTNAETINAQLDSR
jgi:hypothetical protein